VNKKECRNNGGKDGFFLIKKRKKTLVYSFKFPYCALYYACWKLEGVS